MFWWVSAGSLAALLPSRNSGELMQALSRCSSAQRSDNFSCTTIGGCNHSQLMHTPKTRPERLEDFWLPLAGTLKAAEAMHNRAQHDCRLVKASDVGAIHGLEAYVALLRSSGG